MEQKDAEVLDPIMTSMAALKPAGSMFSDVAWVSRLAIGVFYFMIDLVFTPECPENISLLKQDGIVPSDSSR